MKRVVVIGTSGSGKTALSRRLGLVLNCPHVELDALHWEANWTMAEPNVFRDRVGSATDVARWVCDGSYTKVRDIVWGKADSLVWLDYPLPLVLARLIRRTFWRLWRREVLWNGNRENLLDTVNHNSLILFAFHQHRRNRVSYPAALAESAHAHLAVARLTSPDEAERWLAGITQ